MGRNHSKDGIEYKYIKNNMRHLDLILFKGAGLFSEAISLTEQILLRNGSFTHCGIVIDPKYMPILRDLNIDKNKLYIFESTLSGFHHSPQDIQNRDFFGCQIRDLEAVITSYDKPKNTKIAWAKLKQNPLDFMTTQKIEQISDSSYTDYNYVPYDYSPDNLCYAACPNFCDKCSCLCLFRHCIFKKNDKMFCSELVVNLYQKFGLLKDIDSESVTPTELLYENLFETPVQIIRNK